MPVSDNTATSNPSAPFTHDQMAYLDARMKTLITQGEREKVEEEQWVRRLVGYGSGRHSESADE